MNERWKSLWVPPWIEANFNKLAVSAPLTQDGERILVETEYAISKLRPEANVLVSQAFDTPAFAERIESLVLSLARRPREEVIQIIGRRLAGALFEIVAFSYLKSKSVQGELVIAPWETQEGYARIFPERKATYNYGQNSGIRGISVPDGLIFKANNEDTCLTGICEYSLAPDKKQMQVQAYTRYIASDLFPDQWPVRRAYINATLGQYLKKQSPKVSCNISLDHRNFRMVWVVPQETNTTLKGEVLFVPFLELEFRKIVTGLLKDLT